jgi:hypothetical protein
MNQSFSERRLVENEVFFRQPNTRMAEGFKDLEKTAKEVGAKEWANATDKHFNFYCECSDENCRKKINLKPSEYLRIHKNSSQFVVLPGHNVADVERIVQSNDDWIVVEKYLTPPKKADNLNATDVDHTSD